MMMMMMIRITITRITIAMMFIKSLINMYVVITPLAATMLNAITYPNYLLLYSETLSVLIFTFNFKWLISLGWSYLHS